MTSWAEILLSTSLMIFLISLASIAAGADLEPVASQGDEDCSSIAGEYEFWGTTESEEPTSFLQRLSRPSRQGVRWVRIVKGSAAGAFSVSFLGEAGQAIGNDVRLVSSCVHGKWEERNSFEGNSDGTLVKGSRVWKYYPGENGSVMVGYAATSTSQYFPGITSSPRSAQGVSRFARR